MFGLCLPASSAPSFRPDSGGRRRTPIRVAGSVALRVGGRCFPVCAAQAPGRSVWSGPCAARFQAPGVPQKRGLGCVSVLCIPRPSGSGRQELDARSPWCRAFRPRRLSARALCLPATLPRMSTIQNLRRSLIGDWRPVCSAVGLRSSGRACPFPSPLPPASGGAGPSAACELFSGPARSLCSANGRQCVPAG